MVAVFSAGCDPVMYCYLNEVEYDVDFGSDPAGSETGRHVVADFADRVGYPAFGYHAENFVAVVGCLVAADVHVLGIAASL